MRMGPEYAAGSVTTRECLATVLAIRAAQGSLRLRKGDPLRESSFLSLRITAVWVGCEITDVKRRGTEVSDLHSLPRSKASDKSVRPTQSIDSVYCGVAAPVADFSQGLRLRACSKSLTLWRECSNSWMSAQTSACQENSWVADSPQLAHRVWKVTPAFGDDAVSGSSMKTQRTSSSIFFVRAEDVLVAEEVSKNLVCGLRFSASARVVEGAVFGAELLGRIAGHPESFFESHTYLSFFFSVG